MGGALGELPESHVEPTYKGQPLGHWVEVLGGSEGQIDFHLSVDTIENTRGSYEAREALEHIGTNAIPFLLRWCAGLGVLEEPRPPAGFITNETPALLPPASQQVRVDPMQYLPEGAGRAFGVFGPTAAPVLLNAVTNKAYASFSRGVALATAVRVMGTNAQTLRPLVLQCAEEGDGGLARAAVGLLGAVGAGGPEALAVLQRSLQDPRRDTWRDVTLQAVAALGDMGIPTLARAFSSDDPGTRGLAAHLLVYRLPEALTNSAVLAAAAHNLRSVDEDRCIVAAELLRAADEQARGQKPDLYLPLRERDSLLDHATNILRRLAPELLDRMPEKGVNHRFDQLHEKG
jgi:hypothetical protein